jgi:4-amino-4-deoxy-L-arabinose transferase-like glycosyltransferase
VCAAIAFIHGAVWAVFQPPFQPPDEAAHVSYVLTIAKDGTLPGDPKSIRQHADAPYAPDVLAVLRQTPYAAEGPPVWSPQADAALRRSIHGRPLESGGATYVAVAPPLYYALVAIPTRAASGLNILDRLLMMRLFSSLLAAMTVAVVFLFLRELLPTRPWAWAAGALAVAFQPLFGHLAGAVSVDNMLIFTSAVLFYLIARAFRRGLTVKLGVAIGAAALAGTLTKATAFGLLPGAAIGLLIIAWRMPSEQRRTAIFSLAAGALVFALPYAVWLWANTEVFGRDAGTTTGGFTDTDVTQKATLGGQFAYTWQFFLPRLPFMHDYHPRFPYYGLWQIYVEGFVGRFGFFQYQFPAWGNILGGTVLVGIAAAAGNGVWRTRAVLKRRGAELATYLLMFLGVVGLVSIVGYRYYVLTGASFEQTRYLFPALTLWGALVVVAAIGLRTKRFAEPVIGTLIVVLVMGQAFSALLLSLGRNYGYLYG